MPRTSLAITFGTGIGGTQVFAPSLYPRLDLVLSLAFKKEPPATMCAPSRETAFPQGDEGGDGGMDGGMPGKPPRPSSESCCSMSDVPLSEGAASTDATDCGAQPAGTVSVAGCPICDHSAPAAARIASASFACMLGSEGRLPAAAPLIIGGVAAAAGAKLSAAGAGEVEMEDCPHSCSAAARSDADSREPPREDCFHSMSAAARSPAATREAAPPPPPPPPPAAPDGCCVLAGAAPRPTALALGASDAYG
mmetsp:Transcript_6408/g.14812  ORF Transcript_6408/g.14812 Transcript_6408/m.14812 type:complete len:251 (-) Transcript_6408:521-1273(-)